jgi:O-antigen/teichoic acid export membrane protein
MSKTNSQRIFKNFGVVLRGRGIAAVCNMIALALMANSLSPVEFGLVVLLHTYVLAIRGFLNFRTFEAIVKYGVPLHESGDNDGLRKLLRITTSVDVMSSILATLLGVFAASITGKFLHWDAQMVTVAGFYSLIMLTTVTGTPNGVLRIYDRFDVLGIWYTISPAIRLFGVVIAWFYDAKMLVFVGIWAAAFVFENCWIYVRGHREVHQHMSESIWRGFRPRELRETSPDFRHFLGVVYWQTNVDMLPKHLAVLLAGSLLGPAGAGMFRLANDFSTILSKPGLMLREVLFPDLSRMLHNKEAGFYELGLRAVKIAGASGLLLVVLSIPLGAPILGIIGSDYTSAAPLLTLMLLAATFELAGSPLRAAAYALGGAHTVLRIYALSSFVYLGLFYVFTVPLGLVGPGIAACIGGALTLVRLLLLVRKFRRS